MLKILQVINSLSSGGAEVFVTQLVRALSVNCEVKLLTYAGELDKKGVSLKADLENNGIEYISLAADTVIKKMMVPLGIASVIDQWKPDLVHVHMIRSEQFVYLSSLLTRHKFKAIRTKHDERLYPKFVLNRLLNGFYKKNIACSSSAYDALRSMGLSGNSVIVKNGIELKYIKQLDSDDKSKIRSEIGIRDDRIMCLNIGSMHLERTGFQKAQDIILRAIAEGELAEKCHVVFLGGGSGADLLKAQSVKLGIESSVSFEGVVSNVMDYVSCADIILMPSRWEGLPIAAIEVACSGVPMILSKIRSFDEFDGKSVIRCEPDSVRSLIWAMKAAFDRLCQLKREARQLSARYRREFAIEDVAATHVRLYQQVLLSS